MKPEKVLITGNMGYVGPAVSARLRQAFPDATLVGVDTAFFAHCLTGPERLPESLLNAQSFADIRALPNEILNGVDAVVNLAAVSNDPMGSAFEDATMDINFHAGIELAKAAKAAGARSFVFASSCSVYGAAEGGPRREHDPLAPQTAYARSKIASEEALEALADEGFSVTCLRFPTACGMSPRLRLDLVLNDFVASALASGEIKILSDGTPWRPLIDTKDMARAIEWAAARDPEAPAPFLAINVGTDGCNYQVKDLAHAVQEQLPGVSISINSEAAPDKRSYQVNFDRYRELAPEHLPQCNLAQSIGELIEGLKAQQFADACFRESGLIRLKVLSEHKETGRLDQQLRWQA